MIKRVTKWLIAYLVLYPLVNRNFRQRVRGQIVDKAYWADTCLFKWGYAKRKIPEWRDVLQNTKPMTVSMVIPTAVPVASIVQRVGGIGVANFNAKLSTADVRSIHTAYKAGTPIVAIANFYSISSRQIQRIVSGKSWKHLEK